MTTDTSRLSDYTQNEMKRLATLDACGFLAAYVRNNLAIHKTLEDFTRRDPDARRRLDVYTRAAVPPGTTSDAVWASPLAHGVIPNLIVEAARAASVLSRMPIVPVPPAVPVPVETGAPIAAFVGEGLPTPATAMTFGAPTVTPAKVGTIVALTAELVKLGTPAASMTIRNALAAAIAKAVDTLLLGSSAPVANVSPGGIFNGLTPIAPSGTTAAACAKDAATVVATHLTNVPDPSRSVFCCPPATAGILRTQYPHEPLTVTGGSFLGLPAIVSSSVGARIAAIDCGRLLVSDDGLELDASKFASVQMNDGPDAPPTGATIVTSFWQCDLVGVKAIRFVSWKWGTATPQATVCSPTAYVPGT